MNAASRLVTELREIVIARRALDRRQEEAVAMYVAEKQHEIAKERVFSFDYETVERRVLCQLTEETKWPNSSS